MTVNIDATDVAVDGDCHCSLFRDTMTGRCHKYIPYDISPMYLKHANNRIFFVLSSSAMAIFRRSTQLSARQVRQKVTITTLSQ